MRSRLRAGKPVTEHIPSTNALVASYWGLVSITGLVDFVFGAVYVAVLQGRGLGGGTIGAVLAVSVVASNFVELPSGAVGDRYGQRKMVVLGLTLWGAGLVLFGALEGVIVILLSLCLWAAGLATYSGAPISLVINEVKARGDEARIDDVIRWAQVLRWTSSAVGAGLTFGLLRFLEAGVLIIAGGLLLIAAAILVRLTWNESRTRSSEPLVPHIVSGVRQAFSPGLVGLLVADSVMMVAFGAMIVGWQPAALDRVGFAQADLGVLLLSFSIAAAIGSYLYKYVRWAADLRGIWLLTAAMAGGLALAGLGSGPLTVIGFVAAETVSGTLFTALAIAQQKRFRDTDRNTLTSAFETVNGFAWALGTFAFGLMWGAFGIGSALLWVGVGVAATAALAVLLLSVFSGREASAAEDADRKVAGG